MRDRSSVPLDAFHMGAGLHQQGRRLPDPGVEIPHPLSGNRSQARDRKAANPVAHGGMDLLEYRGRRPRATSRTGYHTSGAALRMPPERRWLLAVAEFDGKFRRPGPDHASRNLRHDVTPPAPVEPEHQPVEAGREELLQVPEYRPKLHQGVGGDVTAGQLECVLGPT